MMIGSITFPIGFFIVGWTSDPTIHWFPSVLGFAFIGMSFLLIFQASRPPSFVSVDSRAYLRITPGWFELSDRFLYVKGGFRGR